MEWSIKKKSVSHLSLPNRLANFVVTRELLSAVIPPASVSKINTHFSPPAYHCLNHREQGLPGELSSRACNNSYDELKYWHLAQAKPSRSIALEVALALLVDSNRLKAGVCF